MKKKVLITAYAVNPYKGSEDGIAWNIIRQMAAHNEVTAITRENNQASIDEYLAAQPLPNGVKLKFAYFDLPYWMRFWKKEGRGALLYHYLWHFSVIFFILKQRFNFDLAHHLNFNNDWTPSFLWLLRKPFVWGPIGHHPKVPRNYIKKYGIKATFLEELKWLVKKCFWTFDPFLKITKYKAVKIIGLNTSVQQVLNLADDKIAVIPAAGNERPNTHNTQTDNSKFRVLSIGRLVSLKGFDLTINAFAKFYHQLPASKQINTQLVLIGKGPQKQYLADLISKHKLPKDIILFKKWMDRRELAQYYANSQVFLFPSHEGAGMVVPEAMSYGLPVVCFDNYGPGELMDKSCGISIPYGTYNQSINDFSEALSLLFNDEAQRRQLSINAKIRYEKCFTWEGKGQQIQEVYETVLQKRSILLTKFV